VIGRILAAAVFVAASSLPAAAVDDRGTMTGRVVNGTDETPVAGAEVRLVGAGSDGSGRVVHRAVTGPDGQYKFTGLPAGGDRVYALDAVHDGGLFAGGAVRIPGTDSVIDTTLRVWPTITDPQAILVRRDDFFLEAGEDGLQVIEAVTVVNPTSRAYIGRAPGRPGETATLGFALPATAAGEGVQIVESTLDVPGLVPTDFGFGVTVAVPPGTSRFTFAYGMAGAAGAYDFDHRTLYPTLETAVHARPPLVVRSNRLVEDGVAEVGDVRYRRWSTEETLNPADELVLSVVAEATGSPGLNLGIAAAALLGVALFVGAFLRRRPPPQPETRGALLESIAELDNRHDQGQLDDRAWAERRAALKARLRSLEPTS
jgi:hypothetical protein